MYKKKFEKKTKTQKLKMINFSKNRFLVGLDDSKSMKFKKIFQVNFYINWNIASFLLVLKHEVAKLHATA